MFTTPSTSTARTLEKSAKSLDEEVYYSLDGESVLGTSGKRIKEKEKKFLSVGSYLPYGPRLYFETPDNVVRMKDIGVNNRIILIGVIGSFTPDCWNRHLFLVLQKLRYFQERNVDYICCVSTNDPFVHRAWGLYLGCENSVMMWADPTKRFTQAIGMDIIVPWLDNSIRSRRYIILADNMLIKKIIVASKDDEGMTWQCEHLAPPEGTEEEDDAWV